MKYIVLGLIITLIIYEVYALIKAIKDKKKNKKIGSVDERENDIK